jgi:hypothetical protein
MPDVASKTKSLHALSFGKLAPKDYNQLSTMLVELRDILVANESTA